MFLSIDAGTTFTKCFLYNKKGQLLTSSAIENTLITRDNG